MMFSDDYPWTKMIREYAMYCTVGCFNVAIFAALYLFCLLYTSPSPRDS